MGNVSKVLLSLSLLILVATGCFFSIPKEFKQASITGMVVDPLGNPLENVTITIIGTGETDTTDSTGAFYFTGLNPGSYIVEFKLEGYTTVQKRAVLHEGTSKSFEVKMVPIGGASTASSNPFTSAIPSTTLEKQQAQATSTQTNPVGGNVHIIYVANAGPPIQPQETNPQDLGSYDPTTQYPSTPSVTDRVAVLYGWDPLKEITSKDTGIPTSDEEAMKASQYRDKKPNNLMVVNSVSRTAIGFIEWSPQVRPLWLKITPQGMLYVADSANNITAINTKANNAVVATISMGEYIICDLAVGARGTRLYCALSSGTTPAVGVIDTLSNSFIKNIPLPRLKDGQLGQPWGIAAMDSGEKVFVTLGTPTGGEVVIINGLDYAVEASVTVGSNPFGVAVTPDGRKLFVANNNAASVSVVDITSKQVISTIGVGIEPVRVAITPDGNKVLVSNKTSSSVTLINAMTNSVINTMPVGREPIGIAITQDGKYAYVANNGSDNVSIIDLTSGAVIGSTIPFPGGKPFDVAVY